MEQDPWRGDGGEMPAVGGKIVISTKIFSQSTSPCSGLYECVGTSFVKREYDFENFNPFPLQGSKDKTNPAGVPPWVGRRPMLGKVTHLVPGQGTGLNCRLNPQ